MKKFNCSACGEQVFFENSICEACGEALAFDPACLKIVAGGSSGERWQAAAAGAGQRGHRRCANFDSAQCNWLLADSETGELCRACRHNRTIPDLSIEANLPRWRAFEAAKRRLFYSLLTLRLPLKTRHEDSMRGLVFDCIDDVVTLAGDRKRAMTGHDNGIITIALAEADPVKREDARTSLGETYRTLLGHLRHEIGHYYWSILVPEGDAGRLENFRALFSDERADYAEALRAHYATGPKPGWQANFVSAYAVSHPWEDFAETWQHYMHIVDTLETARAFRIAVASLDETTSRPPFDPYHLGNIDALIAAWVPLTIAINCLNRSMGQPDLYPFVLSAPAIAKLDFVRALIADAPREPVMTAQA